MKSFEYADQEIGSKEIFFSVASMAMASGMLSFPRILASKTIAFDGWIPLMLGGLITVVFVGIAAKLSIRFHKKTFLEYTSTITGKFIAHFITFLLMFYFLVFAAYQTRGVSNMAKLYLFDNTPTEVIALIFLLVLVYAVSGTRTAILRINIMFLPIVLIAIALVHIMNIKFIELEHIRPFFVTKGADLMSSTLNGYMFFIGYLIVLFYSTHTNKPKIIPKVAMWGMVIPILFHFIFYFFAIGVFSNEVTSTMIYSSIEMAKEVNVPGGFFERFESVYFTIWVMTIFTTGAMAFDITIYSLGMLFKKSKKIKRIFMVTPIIFLIAMVPQNIDEMVNMEKTLGYCSLILGVLIIPLILIIAMLRGVKGHD